MSEEPVLRRHFPEDMGLLYYEPTDRRPAFEALRNSVGEPQTITLRNCDTGKLETLEFSITGATESPITTVKWIWGPIATDDSYRTELIFDYLDGKLVAVKASTTARSVPVEKTAERSAKIGCAAELTRYDIFSKD
ncbi:MAG: hypothetical protein IKS31_04150 [Clostridia bacterium]|nr:hypothetical protein [Clostridia bacterium]